MSHINIYFFIEFKINNFIFKNNELIIAMETTQIFKNRFPMHFFFPFFNSTRSFEIPHISITNNTLLTSSKFYRSFFFLLYRKWLQIGYLFLNDKVRIIVKCNAQWFWFQLFNPFSCILRNFIVIRFNQWTSLYYINTTLKL